MILQGTTAFASEPASLIAGVDVSAVWTSNIFMNSDNEDDFIISPAVSLGADFADFLSAGYDGRLNIYTINTDLINHQHALYFLVNPAWGKWGQNEFMARVTLVTQRYRQSWSRINNFKPVAEAAITLEPVSWFRWSLYQSISYTWLYDDTDMDYLDLYSRMSFQFTMQTRTTVTPRFAYGWRWYAQPGLAGVVADRQDHRIEAGIHFSQGLWKNAGLQADYSWNKSFGVAALITRNMAAADFSYLDESFLFSGHQAYLGLKQIAGRDWTIQAGAGFESRAYGGWVATG